MTDILQVSNLTKHYNGFTLDCASLNVSQGCVIGIIGPNGSGKTTLIKIIMNHIRSDSGDINIFGLGYPQNEKEIKNRIGFVAEERHFYRGKTVAWVGMFASQLFERWNENRFSEYLRTFKLNRSSKVEQLSKGSKLRLSLALALSHNADLYIMDEPTTGLDPAIRRDILNLMRNIARDEEKTVIFSSHITDDLARIADFVAFMDEGKIILQEQKDELLAKWKGIRFKEGILGGELEDDLCNVQHQPFGNYGITRDFDSIRDQLADAIAGGDVNIENLSLDDILISLVKGD
jgi:ABC-2 type transport system ATP-binding protein